MTDGLCTKTHLFFGHEAGIVHRHSSHSLLLLGFFFGFSFDGFFFFPDFFCLKWYMILVTFMLVTKWSGRRRFWDGSAKPSDDVDKTPNEITDIAKMSSSYAVTTTCHRHQEINIDNKPFLAPIFLVAYERVLRFVLHEHLFFYQFVISGPQALLRLFYA